MTPHSKLLRALPGWPPELALVLQGLAADLTLVAIMACGNDYMPRVKGLSLAGNSGRPGLWKRYLTLRSQPQWAKQ